MAQIPLTCQSVITPVGRGYFVEILDFPEQPVESNAAGICFVTSKGDVASEVSRFEHVVESIYDAS